MMGAIPLSLGGVIPGHWVHGAFFTATSMIGVIALAGIMVRNSILIIDFIQLRVEDGIPLKQAVVEAGAVRTRPILLTAGTVVIGAIVILFDPIFQGLAIALIYYMVESRNDTDSARPAPSAAATTPVKPVPAPPAPTDQPTAPPDSDKGEKDRSAPVGKETRKPPAKDNED